MKLFAEQQWRHRHTAQIYGHGGREERVGWMERIRQKYTLPYVKQIANGNLLYDSGNSNQGSKTTQRGRTGWKVGGKFKREGIYVHLWLIHVDVWQKPPPQHCKAIIFQLKINKFLKILKDDTVKVLSSIYQQNWRTQQWPQD